MTEDPRAPPAPVAASEIKGVRRGGDLLTARRDGNQAEGRGARLDRVPCTTPLGLAGTSPRREEITTRTRCARARTTRADYARTQTRGAASRRRSEPI
jgi:hypothetical protein